MKQNDLFTEEEKEIYYKATGERLKSHFVSEDRFQEIKSRINSNRMSFLNKYIIKP